MRLLPVDLLSTLHRLSHFLLLLQPLMVFFVLRLLPHCSGREIGHFCVAAVGSSMSMLRARWIVLIVKKLWTASVMRN